MAKDYKMLRPREFIDEDMERLETRLDEIRRIVDYIRQYNRDLYEGRAAEVESPYGFALNRVDDLAYSLTKKRMSS